MNPGTFGLPAQRVGIVSLGTKPAIGSSVFWRNLPAGARRLSLLLNNVSGSAISNISVRMSPNSVGLSSGYFSGQSNLAVGTISSGQGTGSFIIGNMDAINDVANGMAIFMRDDYGSWILISATNRFNASSNWVCAGAAPPPANPAQEMKTLEVNTAAGVFDNGTMTLFAEFDAPTT